MGWLDNIGFEHGQEYRLRLRLGTMLAPVRKPHLGLFWNRLLGSGGVPFDSGGSLNTVGWENVVRRCEVNRLCVVGLSDDANDLGGIVPVLERVCQLANLLGLERDQILLSPVDIWSSAAPNSTAWQTWVNAGVALGLKNWLVDVLPHNRLWRTSAPYSRFASGNYTDYADYVESAVSVIKTANPNAVVLAPVYYDSESDWGIGLLDGLSGLDGIVLSGLVHMDSSVSDLDVLCWSEVRSVGLKMLKSRRQASDAGRVVTVLPLAPAVSGGSDSPESYNVNANAVGAMFRSELTAYLVESGGFHSIYHWLQPGALVDGSARDLLGMRLCDPTGSTLTVSGWWYLHTSEHLQDAAVPEVEGIAHFRSVADTDGIEQRGSGLVGLVGYSADSSPALVMALACTEPNGLPCSMETDGASVGFVRHAWLSVSTLDSAQLMDADEPAPILEGFSWSGTGIRFTPPGPGLLLVLADRVGSGMAPLGPMGSTLPVAATLQDGVLGERDLRVALEVDDSFQSFDGILGELKVHTGAYVLKGRRGHLYRSRRQVAVFISAGRSVTELPVMPAVDERIQLYDDRGQWLPLSGTVRLFETVNAQHIGSTGAGVPMWSCPMPGQVVGVRLEKDGSLLYPVDRLERLTANSYYVDTEERRLIVPSPLVRLDYVADVPDVRIDEYVWYDATSPLLARRVPAPFFGIAYHLTTGKSFAIAGTVERGLTVVGNDLPAGTYLLRYYVDRSFCVSGRRLVTFALQPSPNATAVVPVSDGDWVPVGEALLAPFDVRAGRVVALVTSEWREDPLQRVRRLDVQIDEYACVSWPGWYCLRVLALDRNGAPVRGVRLEVSEQSGRAFGLSGETTTSENGDAVLWVEPGGDERWRTQGATLVVRVPGTGISTSIALPPCGLRFTEGWSAHAERIVSTSEDYDYLVVVPVVPSGGLPICSMTVRAVTGWVAHYMVDRADVLRRESVSVPFPPMGEGTPAEMVTVDGILGALVLIPKEPCVLMVSAAGRGSAESVWRIVEV